MGLRLGLPIYMVYGVKIGIAKFEKHHIEWL